MTRGFKHTVTDNGAIHASLQMATRQISVFCGCMRPQLPAEEMAEVVHVCGSCDCVLYRNGPSIMHRPQTRFCAKPRSCYLFGSCTEEPLPRLPSRLLVWKPKHAHKSRSLRGAIGANRACRGQQILHITPTGNSWPVIYFRFVDGKIS